MSVHNLHSEARRHSALHAELIRRFPDMESDERLLADSLEGFSNLTEEVAAVVASIDDDEMMVVGIKSRVAELVERGTRLEKRAQAKRDAILGAMLETGERKFELATVTISTRNNPPTVDISDETLIPDDFKIYPDPPPPKVDKKTILQALKDGKDVPGAVLSNGSVSIAFRKK